MSNTNIPTPHIEAKKSDFAKTILMPGDPKRSKYIAEKYLTDAKLVNDVRGVQGYTGYYKGKKVSVMAHGMGMPSVSIYAHELFAFYDIKNIIRIGSCGGLTKDMPVGSVVVATSAYTPSNIGERLYKKLKFVDATPKLLETAKKVTKELNKDVLYTRALTYDIFDLYGDENMKKYVKKGCNVAEMEIYALYLLAQKFNKNALSFLTVVDNSVLGQEMTSEQRERSLDDMITCALETAIKLK